jgi:hypothetical protein
MRTNSSYIFILFLFLIGCSRSPQKGVYLGQADSTNYFELKNNNSFFFSDNGNNVVGKYEEDAKTLTLVFEDGHAKRYEAKDNIFLDEQGRKWVFWSGGETGLSYEKMVRARIITQKNKNDIIDVLNLLGSNAFAYRKRPVYYAGGQNSYIGYSIPRSLAENSTAKFFCLIKSDSVQFIASSILKPENAIEVSLDKDGKLSNWVYYGEFK